MRVERPGEFVGGDFLDGGGWNGVEIDVLRVDDGQRVAIGGEVKVLAGALNGIAEHLEEFAPAFRLVDDDGLRANESGGDFVCGYGQQRAEAAEGKAAGLGSETEGGSEVIVKEVLLPHLIAAQVEGPNGLGGGAAVTAEGEKLRGADEDRAGAAA